MSLAETLALREYSRPVSKRAALEALKFVESALASMPSGSDREVFSTLVDAQALLQSRCARTAAEVVEAFSTMQEADAEVRKSFDSLVALRSRLSESVKMLQQSDQALPSAKLQKMQKSVEGILSQMQSAFPHLVNF